MDANGNPASRPCSYASIVVDTEHVWDVGAGEVNVENANRMAGEGEREGKLGCDAGLADSAFTREDLRALLSAER